MVRKHFTLQLWRKKSKWIIKGIELKWSSLEHPILQSGHLIPLLQKKLNCRLFLQFTQVSFSKIRVRKAGMQCITLSQYSKICTKSPLLPQTSTWVCWFNSPLQEFRETQPAELRLEPCRFILKGKEVGGNGSRKGKKKQTFWLGNHGSQREKEAKN